jgi:hypothetical protein
LQGGEDGRGLGGFCCLFFCCRFGFFCFQSFEFVDQWLGEAYPFGGRLNFGFGGQGAVGFVGGDFFDGF